MQMCTHMHSHPEKGRLQIRHTCTSWTVLLTSKKQNYHGAVSAFGSNTSTSNHSHSWPFYGGRWEATLSSTLGQPRFTLPSFFFLHTWKVLRQTGFFLFYTGWYWSGKTCFLHVYGSAPGMRKFKAFVLNAISKIAFAWRVRESHNWNGIACISFGIIKCYGIQAVFLQLKCLELVLGCLLSFSFVARFVALFRTAVVFSLTLVGREILIGVL